MRSSIPLVAGISAACLPVAAALASASTSLERVRQLAAAVYGPRAAAYMGFCPHRLLVWLVAWVGVRHLVVPLLVAAFHARAAQGRGTCPAPFAVLAMLAGFSGTCLAGALIVSFAVSSRRLALRWAFEVAEQSVLSALPLLASTLLIALILRERRWPRRVALALVVGASGVASAALPGRESWPLVPGAIDAALARGDQVTATFCALAWATLPLITAFAVRRRSPASLRVAPALDVPSIT